MYAEVDFNANLRQSFLLILDITNPREPSFLGTYELSKFASDVTVGADLANVAAADDGLVVVDVTDPTATRRMGNYMTPGGAWQVFLSGN